MTQEPRKTTQDIFRMFFSGPAIHLKLAYGGIWAIWAVFTGKKFKNHIFTYKWDYFFILIDSRDLYESNEHKNYTFSYLNFYILVHFSRFSSKNRQNGKFCHKKNIFHLRIPHVVFRICMFVYLKYVALDYLTLQALSYYANGI